MPTADRRTLGGPGEFGTKAEPLHMAPLGWERLHPWLLNHMRHVHTHDGRDIRCVRNRFGQRCKPQTLPDWSQECAKPGCTHPAVTRDIQHDLWFCSHHGARSKKGKL